jgi:hypothetical protein
VNRRVNELRTELIRRTGGDPALFAATHLVDNLIKAVRESNANEIRAHADNPNVKKHLLDGEWTGMRMGANLLHLDREN